jgi:hypothetical protein
VSKNSITVDGTEYVKKVPCDSPIRIVILQRGWVAVGYYEQDGDNCVLRDASVIRVWGTTKGLGELVTGPTSKTVLDRSGTMRFHALAVVATLDCEVTSWAARL